MPSLKEVKNRISSVNSTRKITSAMKMVASAKLHGAQRDIEGMRPYEERLSRIMAALIGAMQGNVSSPYAAQRDVKSVALVIFTSNSSLCGAYNANVIRDFQHALNQYRDSGVDVARVVAFGKKGAEAVRKAGIETPDLSSLMEHPAYAKAADIAQSLMQQFAEGQFDRVELFYHHFVSAGKQVLTREDFLPVDLQTVAPDNNDATITDYILEPTPHELIQDLVPRALHLKLFTALLDSLASEHAARVIAMQTATDNADDLLQELTLQYNKSRQYSITAELLDIAGGQQD